MAFNPVEHFQSFDFKNCGHVVAAVSGGSDSMALLLSLHAYFNSIPHRPKLSAITINHELRPDSAHEAAQVAEFCAKLNVPHMIKSWEGAKPATGIQAAARAERRALLCAAAGQLGADVIMTGHTLDDHVETVVMRQRRGSGPGLAGIASASLAYNDRGNGAPIWIVRPLIDVARSDLRDYLTVAGVSWIEDASNQNEAFERVAVRNQLASAEKAVLDTVLKDSTEAAVTRIRLAKSAGVLMAQHAREAAPGLVMIDAEAFLGSALPELTVLLRTLIAFAGSASSLGDGQIVQQIAEQIALFSHEKGKKPWRKTSNGALVDVRQSGVYLLREARSGQRVGLEFDGRYRTIASPGPQGPRSHFANQFVVPPSVVRRAAEMEPQRTDIDCDTEHSVANAHAGSKLRRLINPWPDLVPLFDLELAQNLSRLAGTGEFPNTPVYRPDKN